MRTSRRAAGDGVKAVLERGRTADLLEVDDLSVQFSRGRSQPPLRAVDGISFSIPAGRTVGLVGESGSGKTTVGRSILGLVEPSGGTITFAGRDLGTLRRAQRRELSSQLQVIFQDPYSSLSPTQTIGDTLRENLAAAGRLPKQEQAVLVERMLRSVGLPGDAARRYPSNFSGGQRQRIAIARALMCRPQLVICDEPVSALDLSVQAQVLNLMRSLQDELGLSYLFISHDLPVVRYLSHDIIVLYRGQIMERGDAEIIYSAPQHPYTRRLLDSIPDPSPHGRAKAESVDRTKPTSLGQSADGPGCPFASRCRWATELCVSTRPVLEPGSEDREIACHHWRQIGAEPAPAEGRKLPAVG